MSLWNVKRVKRHLMEQEKIFVKCVSDLGIVYKLCKKFKDQYVKDWKWCKAQTCTWQNKYMKGN